MKGKYTPLYHKIFLAHKYTWEDIDAKIYRKILLEEGHEKIKIKEEMDYLKKKIGEKKTHGNPQDIEISRLLGISI